MDTLSRRASSHHSPRQLDFLGLLFAPADAAAPAEPSLADRLHTRPEAWPFPHAEPLAVRSASERTLRAALTASVFDAYRPRLCVQGAQDHPTPLVESAAMAAATLPRCDYRPILPRRLVDEGALSGAQLETVCRAGEAHAERLPCASDGERTAHGACGPRQGFFLGDGTGVGKGRQVAGILLDNFLQGRRRALWVSENRNLMRDAVRDWTALGGLADVVFDLGDCKGLIQHADGICFASYDTLKGKPRPANGKPDGAETGIDRLEQVVAWLSGGGEEPSSEDHFEGVIVFDEAHNAASALDTQGSRGVRRASQRALVVVELQQRLPGARVVYASATGATEVSNLAYASRLGLWGRGTPFPTPESFVERVSAGGIAAMELVAKDLKSMGLYTARSVSYDGVDYRTLVHDLSADQVLVYDRCAEAWQVVLRGIEAALDVTRANLCGRARAAAYSQFWGAHQRFFLHVLVAMSAPSLIRDMEMRLASGESCVVQLVSTMEAATRAGVCQSGQKRRRPPGPRRHAARRTLAVRRGELPDDALRGVRGRRGPHALASGPERSRRDHRVPRGGRSAGAAHARHRGRLCPRTACSTRSSPTLGQTPWPRSRDAAGASPSVRSTGSSKRSRSVARGGRATPRRTSSWRGVAGYSSSARPAGRGAATTRIWTPGISSAACSTASSPGLVERAV